MVFELLGKTLLHAIQERGALEVDEVKAITQCLLTCLAFVHDDVGVLHTDIKPENAPKLRLFSSVILRAFSFHETQPPL